MDGIKKSSITFFHRYSSSFQCVCHFCTQSDIATVIPFVLLADPQKVQTSASEPRAFGNIEGLFGAKEYKTKKREKTQK
jgi:hypothetical protein